MIKKGLVLLMMVVPALACAGIKESNEVDPIMLGAWAGQGRFFDEGLAKEYGDFPIAIRIHPDHSVSGTIGGATLTDGVITSRPDDFQIRGHLSGEVFDRGSLPAEKKDCAAFVVHRPHDSTIEGEIHLKTNLLFDIAMREARLTLSAARL